MEKKEIIDNLLNRHSLTMDGIYTIMEKFGYIDGYQEGRDLSYYFKKDGKSKYFSNLSVVCEKAKEELSNLSIEDIEKIKMDLADIHEWGCIIQQEDEEDYGEVIADITRDGKIIGKIDGYKTEYSPSPNVIITDSNMKEEFWNLVINNGSIFPGYNFLELGPSSKDIETQEIKKTVQQDEHKNKATKLENSKNQSIQLSKELQELEKENQKTNGEK